MLCSLLSYPLLSPPSFALFPYTTLFRSQRWPDCCRRNNPIFFQKYFSRHRIGCSKKSFRCFFPNRKDRKSTRLNSSHVATSYAVFCLKKKKRTLCEYANSPAQHDALYGT